MIMNLNCFMPVRVICGKSCVQNNANILKEAGKRCLLVTGKNSAVKSGAMQDVCAVLNSCGIEYEIFDKIKQNPLVSDCFEAGKKAREFQADFIVGIGGGSALDAAKAVAIFAADSSLDARSIYTRSVPAAHLPLYLVGTTAGTGSEVTGVSVLTDIHGFKKSISGADCYADVAFCDWKYTCSADYDVSVSTALDAYAHAFESYFAETANDISSLYAIRALELLWPNLVTFFNVPGVQPDEKHREELYTASLYAGLAINVTGTAFPHTAGYILTEKYGISHGKACTAFHPQLMEKAEKYRFDRLEAVCELLHTDKNEILSVITGLTNVKINITEAQATEYCSRWTSPVKNFERTPGGYTAQEAVQGLLALN